MHGGDLADLPDSLNRNVADRGELSLILKIDGEFSRSHTIAH